MPPKMHKVDLSKQSAINCRHADRIILSYHFLVRHAICKQIKMIENKQTICKPHWQNWICRGHMGHIHRIQQLLQRFPYW